MLLIDKYNMAARRWLEKVSSSKSDYYRAAYDQTRATLLAEVDKAWEMTVPAELPDIPRSVDPSLTNTGVQYLQQKLNNIIIPLVDFDNTSVEEALDFLRLRAREIDPDGTGLNFIIRKPSSSSAGRGDDLSDDTLGGEDDIAVSPGSLRIKELKLRDVPLGTVLQYICDATRLRYKLDDHSVVLLPLDSLELDDLYTRQFVVPPDFISKLTAGAGGGDGGGADADPFGGGGTLAADTLKRRKNAQELLKAHGVKFPDRALANHIAATSTLVVHNTLGNLDVIEQIIDAMRGKGPRQVRIMTKFIEIKQENNDELSFDWILSPVGIAGNPANTFLGGGTIGNGTPRNSSDFTNPVIPGSGTDPATNIGTAGLRSGDYAVSRNSIDNILNNPTRTAQNSDVAPGILSLTGLYNDGQVKMIMRGLAQKKGSDIMTAPSVLARSGEKAVIEVVREFIYPTEYEPPEVAGGSSNGGGVGNNNNNGGGQAMVTPATPTAFETRNTGVTLEIQPTIGENNYTIDLSFAPEIVEFEGFINYGSPIQSPGTDALGNPVTLTLTENRIEMPVFSVRKVTTALTIYDGYTVTVGGLMTEQVQNVEDKVPILGDLPIIGRLFQSKSESHFKTNLIIFVTAEIIDAAGARINDSSGGADALDELPGITGGAPMLDGPGLLPNK